MEKMIKEMTNSLSNVSKKKDESAVFEGLGGDEDMSVRMTVDSKGAIKSLVFSEGLKEFKSESPEDFWQCLSDVIIMASTNAVSKISDDAESLDTNEVMNQVTKMTRMGGMDEIFKNFGLKGSDLDKIMKGMPNLLGGGIPGSFNPKKK